MPSEAVRIHQFIDNLKDSHLSGFRPKEKTITTDKKIGFRLDHQGMNNDPTTKPHRIYIQPVKGGKSKLSDMGTGTPLAQIHCDDPEDVQKMKDALKESYDSRVAKLVVV